jgi:hypothetical protein
MQVRLWQIIQLLQDAGLPVRMYLVKARQLGSTTFFSAVIYWLISLNKNKRAICVAHDLPAAHNVGERFKGYYFRSIPALRPRFKRMNREVIHFATPLKDLGKNTDNIGLDSMIFVNTADSQELGRSYTYNYALLTEYCQWPNMGIDVKNRMIALNQAIPTRPNTYVFIESTAQGENYAKDFWDKGLTLDQALGKEPLDPEQEYNGYVKVFVSWCADDEYRKETLKTDYFSLSELPDSRYGDEVLEREHILEELIFWYPLESSDLKWLNHESMCRLAWRRYMIDTKCEGDKFEFKKEYPTTIDDAWGVSSRSIFNAERMLEMAHRIESNRIRAKTFRYHHDDSISDFSRKFYAAKYGKLRIFEPPKEGFRYVLGVDGAQGVVGGDDSSIVVLKLPHLIEVASFNDIIQPAEFAGVCNYLGRLYFNALMGVERNDKGGYAALEFLLKVYSYPNLYYFQDPFKVSLDSQVKYGWITNEVTRQIMIRDAQIAIDNNSLLVNSTELLKQMKTFVKSEKNDKIQAAPGKHDDLVIALLIALQMAKLVSFKPKAPRPSKAPKYSFDWWMDQATGKNKRAYY